MKTDRIGGWLFAPLAYMILSLISSSLMLALFIMTLLQHGGGGRLWSHGGTFFSQWGLSLLITLGVWCFSLHVLRLFFKRSRRFPKHFIAWLLVMLLLALKSFAFSPISDTLALRGIVMPLLAAAVFVPYIKRSARVRQTFIEQ
ncbi:MULTISPECIES: DUF2569 domain-containing protein [Edwardsiella]|uniref:DUF2569 domain-containing protein n=2 Tax=Edwardsiella anguillarum TaxID=1821960 RepID=A0ABY8SJX4_9GAMM|nr:MULTISPECIES: DUF2569 domain-containing protein [Edwardsiella]AKM47898.1 membrane protein [Edwardsiella sp. EA181011]GAJ68845.1 hypothetical protein MA13_contig00014-0038 [Edwardsiella piscicida]AIJ10159.1 Putative membrane protein precursor [Edwardsiella anguillarum ET080813]AKR77736.1 DUF2569 domain-containing protein [Edwardsiella sp. LADL05-105]KAB0592158.1 DUF2569 domain-containing protein [Edwardsiella anguillarum]